MLLTDKCFVGVMIEEKIGLPSRRMVRACVENGRIDIV